MKFIRGIYDWVLSWAYKPSGPKALGAISFCEASFFPIPPDVLLIPLAISRRNKALAYSLICSVASVLGAGFGYFIGKFVWWADQNTFSEFANIFINPASENLVLPSDPRLLAKGAPATTKFSSVLIDRLYPSLPVLSSPAVVVTDP